MRSQTTRLPDGLPDCRNLQTNRCTVCSRTSNQIARCIARCIARQADGHAEQMHEQQKKLNPIEDFACRATNVPNAVSTKNPWHRWTSIGNVDRYQADEPAERLRNAWKTPEKRWKRSSVLFCLFLVCSGDEHTLGAGWDVMGWFRPPHGFATCACWLLWMAGQRREVQTWRLANACI
jgi:hypothetical protein